jgi:hypothetical protein
MMQRIFSAMMIFAMTAPLMAQETLAPSSQGAPAPVMETVQKKSSGTLLSRDTPVELMATYEITSQTAKPGTRFKLRLNKPVVVDGVVVAPVGATAHGEVLSAISSGGLGKNGEMQTRLLYLGIGDIQIPIEGNTSSRGSGAGSAGAALLLTGVAGLFHRGNNAKIKAGEIMIGYVGQDVLLDLSVSPPRQLPLAATPQNLPVPAASAVTEPTQP